MRIGIKVTGLSDLKSLPGKIKRFPEVAAQAGVKAANETAALTVTAAARDITQRYNLHPTYVRDRLNWRKAGGKFDYAIVFGRVRWTRLARYESRQLTVSAPRAKGDALRGIPAGRKAAGISFKVLRDGKRWELKRAFFIPLRAGKLDGGNGMGIFWRDNVPQSEVPRAMIEEEINHHAIGWRKTPIKHLYGMSVHQSFAYWRDTNAEKVVRMLHEKFNRHFANELRKRK